MNRLKRTISISVTAVFLCLGVFESVAGAAWFEQYGIQSKYELSQPSAVPKLVRALGSRDAGVRRAAAKYLAKLGRTGRDAVPALAALLKDPHPNVRATAVQALGAMGEDGLSAGPALVAALTDKDADVRLGALRTLKFLRYQGGDFATAVRQMAASDPHRRVKAEAGLVASGLGGERARPLGAAAAARPAGPALNIEPPAAVQENRYGVAVVIGNRRYASVGKDVPDVNYAHNDADAIVGYVTRTLGFREGNVIVLKDAGQADLVATFGGKGNPHGKLFDWVRPGVSDVFVYYSGHGAPGLSDGRSYLLPVDADPLKVELNGYPLDVLYANLGQIPARTMTVVLDACFSGLTPAGTMVKGASSISMRPIEPKVGAKEQTKTEQTKTDLSRLTVLAASRPEQVASWDETSRHGLFTSHFLQGISSAADREPFGNGDGKVTLIELKKYLEEEVTYEARRSYGRQQDPQVSGRPDVVLSETKAP